MAVQTSTDVEVSADRTPARARAAVVALPTVVAAVLGTLGIGNRQLWLDELSTWRASTLPRSDYLQLLHHIDLVQLPYYEFMRVWVGMFGASAVALRLPSVFAMTGATALVAVLGTRLASPRVALLAAGTFAVLPAVTRYAQEARPYAFVVAGAAGATLLLIDATRRGGRLRWVAYGVVLALTVALHLVAALLLVAHLGWVLRHRRVLPWLAVAIPALAPAGVLAAAAAGERNQISWVDASWSSLVSVLSDLFLSYLLPFVVLVLAAIALVPRRLAEPHLAPDAPGQAVPGAHLLLALWAVAPLAIVYFGHPIVDLLVPRYLLFTLPAWALLAGLAIERLALASNGRVAAAAAAGLAALVLLSVPGQYAARTDPDWWPDLRGAAALVVAGAHPGDGVIFIDSHWNERLSYQYYGESASAPRDVLLARPEVVAGYAPPECADLAACLAGTGRVWLITEASPSDPLAGLPDAEAQLLRDRYTIVGIQHTHLVTVALLSTEA
jgi:mannosyltransferase